MERLKERFVPFWGLGLLIGLTGLLTLAALYTSAPLGRAATVMLINLIVVVGLFTYIGNSGVFSFGHTAFMAIGAYVTGLLTMAPAAKEALLPSLPHALQTVHVASVPGVLIGATVAALSAMVVGVPIARMARLAAGLSTLALLAIVYNVIQNLQAVGGSSGISEIPIASTTGTVFVWAIVAIVIAFAYQRTRSCARLRASREDEVAARSIGISIARERWVSFVVSAFIVGLAGGVFGQYFGSFTPSAFYLEPAFLVLVMLIVGGMTSLSGAVIGVLAIASVKELLKTVESGVGIGPLEISARPGLANVGLALILIATMIWRPLGIMGGRELTWPFSRNVRPPAGPGESEPSPQPERVVN